MKQIPYNNFQFISTPKITKFILDADDYIYNILVGSVRSGKDYCATIAFCLNVLKSDAELHLIAATDVRNCLQIIGQYILDFLPGVAYRRRYNEAPSIEIKHNGKTKHIIFAGGKNVGSDRGIRGITIGSVYFTEINLLNMNFIDQAIKRTLTFKDKRKIYATFNPKGIRDPFIVKFINLWQKEQEEFPQRKILNFKTFTLIDNPIFTEEDIRQIKAGYDPESVNYRRDILGQFADPSQGLYRVRDYNVLDSKQIQTSDYNEYFVVADMGESLSATVFLLGALYWNNNSKQRELHILKEYHHINKKLPDSQKLSSTDYAEEYVKFIKDCILYMNGKYPSRILYDGTHEDMRNINKALKQNGIHITPKYVLKLKEDERIKTTQSWLYQGKVRINNYCRQVINNLKDATHDEAIYERTGQIKTKETFTDEGHLDALDCTSYLIAECVKKM